MRKPDDLEDKLSEAIDAFGKKLDRDASLRRYFDASISNFAGRSAIKKFEDDPFAAHLYLTGKLREAYLSGDIDLLESLPNWMGIRGDNSIAYSLIMGRQQLEPFSNETTGQQVSLVNNIFDRIARAAGGLTLVYGYLRELVAEFSAERDILRGEIIDSVSYQTARNALPPSAGSEADKRKMRADLRKAYRVEELKRIGRIEMLLEKAEVIYGLAAQLFDGVRQYRAA